MHLLEVYILTGREVRSLINRVQPPGEYRVTSHANDLFSVVYRPIAGSVPEGVPENRVNEVIARSFYFT